MEKEFDPKKDGYFNREDSGASETPKKEHSHGDHISSPFAKDKRPRIRRVVETKNEGYDSRNESRPRREGDDDDRSTEKRRSYNPNFDKDNHRKSYGNNERRYDNNGDSEQKSGERKSTYSNYRENSYRSNQDSRREGGYNRENRNDNSSREDRFNSYNRDNKDGQSGGYNNDRKNNYNREGGYNNERRSGGYDRDNRNGQSGGYNNDRRSNYNREGGYNNDRRNNYNDNRGSRDENPDREDRFNSYNRDNKDGQSGGYNSDRRNSYNREGGYNSERRSGGYDRNNREGQSGGYNNDRRNNYNREGGYRNNNQEGRKSSYGKDSRYGDKRPAFGNKGRKPIKPYPEGGFDSEYQPKSYPTFAATPINDPIRLNKYISMSGLCSRREADEYIKNGEITVNGQVVTELGVKINPGDDIRYNGTQLQGEKRVYILMNKPKGFVTTVEDPNADRTVMEIVKNACQERVYPVGRLDKNSLGVLLITNDGELTKKLTHPSHEKKKVYQVSLDKSASVEDLEKLCRGIELEDGQAIADEVNYIDASKKEIGVVIHSGRNRIVRRMFESLGYHVQKLDRVYFAGLTKKGLRRGAWRYLSPKEVAMLKAGSYE